MVTSQKTRDRQRNLEDALSKVRALIATALVRPKRRRPTRPSRGADQRRLDEKKRRGATKQDRRSRDD